jgi:hypothetical protein
MPVANRRRDARYKIRLPVTLIQSWRPRRLLTEDVSFEGLFLESESFPGYRQLLRFRMILPPTGQEFVAHGMAVHWVEPDNALGHRPGIGVQLYALDRSARDLWCDFVAYVKRQAEGRSLWEDVDLADPEVA